MNFLQKKSKLRKLRKRFIDQHGVDPENKEVKDAFTIIAFCHYFDNDISSLIPNKVLYNDMNNYYSKVIEIKR